MEENINYENNFENTISFYYPKLNDGKYITNKSEIIITANNVMYYAKNPNDYDYVSEAMKLKMMEKVMVKESNKEKFFSICDSIDEARESIYNVIMNSSAENIEMNYEKENVMKQTKDICFDFISIMAE